MRNSMIIAIREWKERIGSRSFVLFSFLGPLVVLGLIYVLFALGSEPKQHWKVLIADPAGLMESKIMSGKDITIDYSFADGYIEIDEFANAKKYQDFDALLEVNEKVLSNKISHVFYRNEPSVRMQTRVQYYFERRLEEILIKQFTALSISDFRRIKQPISVSFTNVYDPEDKASDLSGWVGFFYGALIFAFIFLFGMTILRSVSKEKSNRIVEVLLASVTPNQMMLGKIIGVGFAAFFQFIIWAVIIGFGLYFMRENLFPDLLDAANMNIHELTVNASDSSYQESYFAAREYNQFVDLIFGQIHFINMTGFFLLFFIGGYLFYGALFAAIGATMGSESDGQQFVLPLVFLLFSALYSGYFVMNYPDSGWSTYLQYIPFTSPVVVMVKLSQGYAPGEAYHIYLSFLVLLISAFIMLSISARLYKNGILQFGHRVRLKHVFKWLKKS